MEKQYYELPSWLKQRVSDSITGYLHSSKEHHYKALKDFVLKFNPKIQMMPCTGSGFLTAVPTEEQDKIKVLWSIYEKTEQDIHLIRWYLGRLFSQAMNHQTIKDCIPEPYWKYIAGLKLTGESDTAKLFDRNCYDILEQAQLSSMILGTNNDCS